MGMRATILEETMRKMANIALMVKLQNQKNLLMAPMVMMENVRDFTHTTRVEIVPMMMAEHITFPTTKMKRQAKEAKPKPKAKTTPTLAKHCPRFTITFTISGLDHGS
ncbi:hypothetical protein H5410_051026 [Solanum commersonii]|uniref:Uncharacterized protein n=1 Tax=Solanum commersonii TaxID=4109 RepID=A0A9J5WYF4_SOLCO|nr:hypothetical protein H5410_051026 [Solanum commersonii]